MSAFADRLEAQLASKFGAPAVHRRRHLVRRPDAPLLAAHFYRQAVEERTHASLPFVQGVSIRVTDVPDAQLFEAPLEPAPEGPHDGHEGRPIVAVGQGLRGFDDQPVSLVRSAKGFSTRTEP